MGKLWAIMHYEIRNNPKTKALAARLGLSIPTVCGHLGLFWAWVVNLSIVDESGTVNDLTPGALERAAMWEGKRGELFAAMRECGFLDGEPDSETDPLRVHEWGEYYKPLYQDRRDRQKSAERSRRYRERKNVTNHRDESL